MRRALAVAALAAGLLPASAAHAGTYKVNACTTGGVSWQNRSWSAIAAPDIVTDTNCDGRGQLIGLRVDAGKTIPAGRIGGIAFTSPPGTSIADFTLDRLLDYGNPVKNDTHQLYTLYQLDDTVFAGAGDFHDPTRNRLNAQKLWYGYPAKEVHIKRGVVSMRSFASLSGYRGGARTLSVRVGCFPRGGTACSVAAGGRIYHVLYGITMTVADAQAPSATVEAEGLLAGGERQGSDPVVVTAGDNAGIKRVEIVDITGPPQVVGVENYDVGPSYEPGETKTDAGATCSFRLLVPCPGLSHEKVRPSSLGVGMRTLVVRVVDAGDNVVERGPFTVNVLTPSDRGPLNGSGATEAAKVTVRFAQGGRRRTVGYGRRVKLRGRLVNADGQPIAGAQLRLLTRDLRQGAPTMDRTGVQTGKEGRFTLRVRALASRQLQLAWRSHVNDAHFAANGYLTLRAKATGSLRASPRAVRVGRSVRLRGRLKGLRRGGVPIVLQGRPAGTRRWTTFADTTTSRRGTFAARYRFQSAASRGRRFAFRARIGRDAGFPYASGYTRRATVRVR